MFMTAAEMEAAFRQFHRNNPHVYAKLVEIAQFVLARGKRHYGIAAIFERLRWISTFETAGDIYKLNNNFRAYYARLLMRQPEFAGLFQVRFAKQDSQEGRRAADEDDRDDDNDD